MEKLSRNFILIFILIFILFTIFSINTTFSGEQTKLDGGESAKNFSGAGTWSQLDYIKVPKESTISSAFLNISGFDLTEQILTAEDWTIYYQTSNTGWGNFANSYDNNWNTYTQCLAGIGITCNGYIYMNYTKQGNSSSLWEIKTYSLKQNITIPNDCWVYSNSIVSFQHHSYYNDGTGENIATFYCRNSTGWNQLYQDTSRRDFYEDSMNWFLEATYNATLDVGNDGDVEFNHTGTFDTINKTSDFSSEVTDFISTCSSDAQGYCSLPLNISAVDGVIQIDAINITFITTPNILISSPTNNTNSTDNTLDVKYTYTNFSAIDCWYSNDTYAVNTSLTNCANITSVTWAEGQHNVTIWANNTDNNINSSSVTFTIDTLNPDIDWTIGVENNNSNVSQSNIFFNITYTEPHLDYLERWYATYPTSCTSGNGLDIGTSTSSNVTSLSDGKYNYCMKIYDTFGNTNRTEQRIITLDTIAPTSTPSSTSPPDGASYTFGTWTNQNVKVTITGYDSGVGFDNTQYPKYCTDISNTCNPTTFIGSGATISTEGTSYIRYFTNDSIGNNESVQSGEIDIDTTNPNMTIAYPNSGIYLNSNTSISLNFTPLDSPSGLDSCWYSLNGGTDNTTISSCENTTINVTEGSVTINIYVNDSANNINDSESTTFTTDITYPTQNIVYPLDQTYYNENVSELNYTYTETNCDSAWFSKDYGVTNETSVSCGTNFTSITSLEGWNNWTLYLNDSAGNENSSLTEFFKDTIYPDISITHPTNNTNSTDNTLDVNYTMNDTNFDTCWYSNDTFSVNTSLTNCVNITTVIWSEGTHNVIIYANDSVNNINSTRVTFTIDTIPPLISITYPTNNTNYTINTLDINYTFTDSGVGIDSCWYSNDTFSVNTSLTNCVNITTVIWSEGTHNVIIYANDSVNNINSTRVTFRVDTTYPEISIVYPSNNTNSTNNNLEVNYTYIEINPSSCWWTNNSGTTNNTITCGINITAQTWDEGLNNVVVYINDSVGNENHSSATFTIDTIPPSVNIAHPIQDASYSTNEVDFNFTILDAGVGLETCWYINYTDYNVTTDCSTNITISQGIDGTYSINLWANDTLGNTANDSVDYVISTTPPAVTLQYPTNQKWINISTITFNYTATDDNGIDSCLFYINSSSGWHLNLTDIHSGDTSVDINEGNFSIDIEEGFFEWNVLCNDTNNDESWALNNWTIGIDTIVPSISYTGGMLDNNTNTTNTYIYVNVTVTEINEDTITFSLFNETSIVNKTSSTNKIREFTWVNLPDDIYYFNVTINDSSENENKTETRVTRLDDTKPTLSIAEPQAQNYGTNASLSLNYTATDNLIGLSQCWYYIQNSSGYTNIATTTLSDCENTTFSLPSGDINYNIYLFAEDNLGNIQSTSVTFGIRTESPAVVIYPLNNSFSNSLTNNYFNFSVTTNADSISQCDLWANFSGTWEVNQSYLNPSESTTHNFSELNLTESKFIWNVNCSDNFGYEAYSLNNHTFTIDVTFPELNVSSISTTQGQPSFNFNGTISDTYANSSSCKYSIFDSTGSIDGLNENISFTCNLITNPSVTTVGASYNLTIYGSDYAGNENSTTESFTISQLTQNPSGGGGGTTIIRDRVTLEAVNFTITTTNFQSSIDISLAKDSVKERVKQFFITNKGIEPIEVEVICDTQNVNESSQNIDICDYIKFSNRTFMVSPNEENRALGTFSLSTPANSSEGDTYYFNILAIRTVNEETRYSKLSVSSKVGVLATLFKWSYLPFQDEDKEDKISYPIVWVALLLSAIVFFSFFIILRKKGYILFGFFLGLIISLGIFIGLLSIL